MHLKQKIVPVKQAERTCFTRGKRYFYGHGMMVAYNKAMPHKSMTSFYIIINNILFYLSFFIVCFFIICFISNFVSKNFPQ